MVAYTAPDCLPYPEGTDSPCLNTGTVCEPSNVWCDLAEAVETRLSALDETANLATFPPIAWVETNTSFTVTIGGGDVVAPFDTVRVDTADMVNLDADNTGFVITRSGLYAVFGYLFATFDTAGGSSGSLALNLEFVPNVFTYGVSSVTEIAAETFAPLDLAQTSVSVHSVVPLSAGQRVVAQIFRSGVANDFFTVTQASMGAAWVGNLP